MAASAPFPFFLLTILGVRIYYLFRPATPLLSMLVWFVNLLHECSPADEKKTPCNQSTFRTESNIHNAPIVYYRHRSYRQDDNQSGGGRGSFGGGRVGGDPFGTNIRRVYVGQDGELVFERAGEEEKREVGDRADGDVAKSLSKSFELFPALVRRRTKKRWRLGFCAVLVE